MSVQILAGDVRAMLATLPAESVQCVVTSPPYFGLRAYSTTPQTWGGDPEHAHEWGAERIRSATIGATLGGPKSTLTNWSGSHEPAKAYAEKVRTERSSQGAHCPCGAWRGELGSEPTPSLFIEHLVAIFDEVARVLRPDGVIFCNLGDSYAGSGKGPTGQSGIGDQEQRQGFTGVSERSTLRGGKGIPRTDKIAQPVLGGGGAVQGIPAKNLLLIPERFAIAMQDAGWIVRSRIAWCKTSAMPESVRDRPTSAWEHIWMFTKQTRYFWDADAVRTPITEESKKAWALREDGTSPYRRNLSITPADMGLERFGGNMADGGRVTMNPAGANLRNYWLLGPEPSREQHYAAYPSEIPRRCILAATSEKGQCPACGAPWVRMAEKQRGPIAAQLNPKNQAKLTMGLHSSKTGLKQPGWRKEAVASTQTTGWQAGCPCDAGDPVPQTVLDPFLGSGTTALVADQLGRNAVGIELNPTYAEMARRRITNDAPMFADVELLG